MVSTGTKLDRKALVEEQSLEIIRRLLNELGGSRGLAALAARGAHAHLERELGLGSLERVELMLRLGDACGVRLPDRVVADADTVQDLIDALLRAPEGENGSGSGVGVTGASAAAPALASPAPRPDLERQIRSSETLTEIFWLRGRAEPARAHIQLYEESGELRTISFGELYERASAVASELLRRGLEPGQTVALMLPTCAEFFFTFAGILLAGGIPVPIYPPFRADRIAEYAARQANILRNAESRFLITWRQAESLARLLRPRVPSLREVLNARRLASAAAEPESSPKAWRPVETITPHARSSDIAFLQYTSGSTGDPKGVILTHANLLSNIHSIIAGIEVRPEDSCVSWLPLYHDMGLIGAWFVPLFTGIPLIVMSPLAFLSRPERWLRAIHRHRATISPAPNFAYELCVRKIPDKDLAGLDLSSWRAATNGAEPVHAETLERFAARFAPYGFRRESLAPVYGLAEATLAVSAPKMGAGYKVDRIQRAALESEGLAIPAAADADDSSTLEFVNAGKPVPGVEVRLVPLEHAQGDVGASGALENGSRQGTASAVPKNAPPSGVSTPEATRDPAPLGERIEGRLWFRGPSATSGYYRNPRATAELIHEGGWLDSGDLAYWADGELYITGRAKDVIIKAGRNIYPHEVEIIAGKIPGVRTGCVVAFGAPDERTGTERLIIAAELRDPSAAARISDEITRAIDDALGMPPDVIELLAPQSIPKTSSGKLRRSETRRLYLEGKLRKKVQPAWMQIAKL
ncbi:MAG TPA: AMP-binding protein, partial [Methylocystis sp.]|nr:AMP-binding protein [Methylocystis sp.]